MIDEVCDVGNRKAATERSIFTKYGKTAASFYVTRAARHHIFVSVLVIGGILFAIYLVKTWSNGKTNFASELAPESVTVS